MTARFSNIYERYRDNTVRFAGWGRGEEAWCYWSESLKATVGFFRYRKELLDFKETQESEKETKE